MLLSAVSVLVVAQSSSEIPEGLMNNPVYRNVSYPTANDIITFGNKRNISTVKSELFLLQLTV